MLEKKKRKNTDDMCGKGKYHKLKKKKILLLLLILAMMQASCTFMCIYY